MGIHSSTSNMRLTVILLISISNTIFANNSIFLKNKDASEILSTNQLTQEEWNNELLFKLHLTTYKRWDEFLRPWKRYNIGKNLSRCKKKCMKGDKKGWFGSNYGYEELFEPWKDAGFPDDDDKPVFPCANCLDYMKVIQPRWKKIVEHMDRWVNKHSDSDY